MKIIQIIKNSTKLLYRLNINILNSFFCNNFITKKNLTIVTIAFNNLDTLELQYLNLNKYLEDDFEYYIVDNSTDNNISRQIEKWCKLNNIKYKRIHFKYIFNPSESHGYALNYAYKIISKTSLKYVGFLDHDIYPYKKTRIITKIKEGIYGRIQEREGIWYLWPGLCFFEISYIKNFNVNFLPISGLDTGGRLYDSYYKYLNKELINIPIESNLYAKDEKNNEVTIEKIGDWLHIGKLSNWDMNNDRQSLISLIKNINLNE